MYWDYNSTNSESRRYVDVSVQFHNQTALTLGKRPCCPLSRRLGECQRRSQHFGEEKNLLPLLRISNVTFNSLVTY